VDKSEFIYSFNDLRRFEGAVKTVYRSGTDVGQQMPMVKKVLFCTSGAVDIQRVLHRAPDSMFETTVLQAGRRTWLPSCADLAA
jgi:hypothetical protein